MRFLFIRLHVLAALFALAIALLPLHAAAAAPAPAQDPMHPRVMKEEADRLAAEQQPAYPKGTTPTPLQKRAQAIAPLNGGPAREIFGFAFMNSGLNDPSVGYTSWNFNLLTTVAIFGIHVNNDGTLSGSDVSTWQSSLVTNFISFAHAHGTKVVATVIMQDFNPGTPAMCSALANRPTTVAQIARQVAADGVEGLNVDYEGLNGSCGTSDPNTARLEMTDFVSRLRSALPSAYLTVDTYGSSAGDPSGFFNIPGIASYADAVWVMSYDQDFSNYGYPPIAGCKNYCLNPVAALTTYHYNDTDEMAQYASAIPSTKVILGVPYYGRGACVAAATPNQFPTSSTWNPSYLFARGLVSDPDNSNYVAGRDPNDPAGQERYDTWKSGSPNCIEEMYWDDTTSLGLKYDLVNRDNLAGVGLWALPYGGGATELWQELAIKFSAGSTWLMTSSGTAFNPVSLASGVAFNGNTALLAADVSGDGKADLVGVNYYPSSGTGNTWVTTSNGTTFAQPAQWSNVPFAGNVALLAADLTGNGKADLIAVDYDPNSNTGSTWVMLSTGTGFSPPALWSSTPFAGSRAILAADITGTGKASLIAVNYNFSTNTGDTWVMSSTGSAFGAPAHWSTTPFTGNAAILAGDVTGTGKAALVGVNYYPSSNTGNTWVMTSTGSSFAAPAQWSGAAFNGNRALVLGDVSGDKKADLVAVNYYPSSGSGNTWVMTSAGTAFAAPANWSTQAFTGNRSVLLGDVNGDTKADLIAVEYNP